MTVPPRTGKSGLSPARPGVVPLTLLTGFLGAGKTTLVNRVLQGHAGERVAVLVNDFGALNIDRSLVRGEAEGVFSLENGCICCSLRDDLVGAVMRLLDRPEAPERVLLEASGIADPAPIAGTFLAPAFRHRLWLDGVVCVVDAERGLADPAHEALQLRQVGFSDLVVLNKADLAGAERVAALTARLRREFAGARVFTTSHCAVPSSVLFSPIDAAREPRALPAGARALDPPAHGTRFASWSFATEAAFCADTLYELARELPPWLYRAKGVLRLAGRDGRADRRGVLQLVGRRVDITPERRWSPADGGSQLVFIGDAAQFAPAEIESLLNACLRDVKPLDGFCGDNAAGGAGN